MARVGEDRISKVLTDIISSESSSAEEKLAAIKLDLDRKRDYERRKTRRATAKLMADRTAAKAAAAEAEESNRRLAESQAAARARAEEEQRLRANLEREQREAEAKRKAEEKEAKLTEHETWHATQILRFESLQQLANVPEHNKCVKGTECRVCRPGRGVHAADSQARWQTLPRQTDEEIVKAPKSCDPYWDGFWELDNQEQKSKLQCGKDHMLYYQQMLEQRDYARARLDWKKLDRKKSE
jgi:multidrug efflux pump subunit AcrA (membrane-fusion protein)